MAPIFGVQEETVPVDNRDQKEPLNFSINNFYIPGLKGISTVKSNTDENLAPFTSQNYSPINQKHSKSFYGGDENWGPISTDHENWSPGSYSIQSSGFYRSSTNKHQDCILEVSFMLFLYSICILFLF